MAKRTRVAERSQSPARTVAPVPPPPAIVPRHLPFSPRDIQAGTLLFIALVIAYFPALNGALVWDDAGHVTPAPLRTLHGLYRIWFEFGASQQYYPLLHTVFWLEHKLWGDAVVGYHLATLLLHAIAAFLVVAVMRRLSLPGAWLAAWIFALHPVCVESVAWISEQKNTLSLVLYLSSALCYLRFDKERRKRLYWIALAFYVMALLAKSVAATLPITLLLVFWWQRGTLSWKRDGSPLLPWLGVGAASGALTAWVEKTYIGARGADFNLSMLERCLLACRAICFYFVKLFWPADLIFVYPRWTIDAGVAWQYLFPVAVIGVAAAFWLYSRRGESPANRAPLAIFLGFAAALAPALGFVNVYPFVFSYVADHFQYQASLAIIIPFAVVATLAAKRLPAQTERFAPAAAALLLAVLGFLTWRQSAVYRDEPTLYRDTIARNPAAWMAYLNLALIIDKTPGHESESIRLTRKVLEIKPDSAQAVNNLGMLFTETGHPAEGLAAYRKAAQMAPEMETAHFGMASGLADLPGGLDEAIAEYRTAIRLKPDDERAYSGLGAALLRMPGRAEDAVTQYRVSVALDEGSVGPHYDLAGALRVAGHEDEEIAEFRKVIQLKPDYAEAHLNLGAALAKKPDGVNGAIDEYRTALRLKSHYAQAHYDLGLLLSDLPGRTAEAIAEYEAALRDKPDYAEAHCNLGIALADLPGRVPEAIEHFRLAVRLNPKLPEADFAWGMALVDVPGKRPEAIEHFRAALKANPEFPPAHDVLARLKVPN